MAEGGHGRQNKPGSSPAVLSRDPPGLEGPLPFIQREVAQRQAGQRQTEGESGRRSCPCGGGCPRCTGRDPGRPKVQAKVVVGAPDDPYEREADRVAEQVLAGPLERSPQATPSIQKLSRRIQREESEEGAGSGAPASGGNDVDREPVSDQEPAPWPEPAEGELEAVQGIQLKSTGQSEPTPAVSAELAARVQYPGSGSPLPEETRKFFEGRFHQDFSGVRVHDTPQDRRDAGSLGARAFTYGSHIWLGQGESAEDRPLMAHELTHVVQQTGGRSKGPTRPIQKMEAEPRIQRSGAGGVRGKLRELAGNIPGYDLLCLILKKDPITDEGVAWTAVNVFKALVGIFPGGALLSQQLQQSGALESAFQWLGGQIAALNITWEYIKGLFQQLGDEVGWRDVFNPAGVLEKAKRIFGPPLARLKDFAKAVFSKVGELIFEAAISALGKYAKPVMDILKKAGGAISTIFHDPVKFLSNLIASMKLGFGNFVDHILDHLKKGFMKWLLGPLSKLGVRLPEKWDLKGFAFLALEVMGLTYTYFRGKFVKVIGEKRVRLVEKAISFIATVAKGGLGAVIDKITEWTGNIRDAIVSAVREWAITAIIKSAVTQILLMLNPAGTLLKAATALYDAIAVFVERIQEFWALISSIFESIVDMAAGRIQTAAKWIENALSGLIPTVIGFLARVLKLDGIVDQVAKMIKKLRARVDKAMTKLLNYAINWVKKLFKMGQKKAADPKDQEAISSQFDMEGEPHRLSLKIDGGNPVLIMASDTPSPLLERLDKFIQRIDSAGDVGPQDKLMRQQLAVLKSRTEALIQKAKAIPARDAPQDPKHIAAMQAFQTEVSTLSADIHAFAIRFKYHDLLLTIENSPAHVEKAENETFLWAESIEKKLEPGADPLLTQSPSNDFDRDGDIGATLAQRRNWWTKFYTRKSELQERPVRAEGYVRYNDDKNRNLPDILPERSVARDDRGHVVGKILGGLDIYENLIPMKKRLNQNGDWWKMERDVREHVRLGTKKAKVILAVDYGGDKATRRPAGFVFTWQKLDDRGGLENTITSGYMSND